MRLLTSAKKSRDQTKTETATSVESNDPPPGATASGRPAANTEADTGGSQDADPLLPDDAQESAAAQPGASPNRQISLLPLLSLDRTRAKISVTSRKRALEHACEILAGCNDLNARSVLDALLAREKLGSTALGEGVAIPHCRLDACQAPVGVLLTLETAIDYDAPDDTHVDLLFALVVPKNTDDEHLQILSQLAGLLIESDNRATLRQARDHLTLFEQMQRLATATG